MASFEDTPWSAPSLSDFGGDVGAFCGSCLIDLNGAGAKTAGNCKLPYRSKPGAPINQGALRAAAAVLAGARGGVDAPPAAKKAAAGKLVRFMAQAKMAAGDSLMRMAGM